MIITQTFKGGEFYAECTCGYRAARANRWSSSVKQLLISMVLYTSMLLGVAARVKQCPSIFFAPKLPRAALDSSLMKTLNLH
jgi:hypothetical protein